MRNSIKEEKFIKKNYYYHQDLINFYNFNVPPNSNVLEIGNGSPHILANLKAKKAIFVDLFNKITRPIVKKYPDIKFLKIDPSKDSFKKNLSKFDYIIFSDSLSQIKDIQILFKKIKCLVKPSTRIIINCPSFFWLPALNLAEKLKLKRPLYLKNWLTIQDVSNLLLLENFEVIKSGKRLLLPIYIPILSKLVNKYLANLPIFNSLCLVNYIIARPLVKPSQKKPIASIIIPARNERGNIENAIKRLPTIGKNAEIIFVEGHSNDNTFTEIKRVARKYHWLNIKYTKQSGIGKADAVRKGFKQAQGDFLIILDADLTVPPEDLTKFYDALASGKGEFINGCRLVYPMEQEAMQSLNVLGNKFFSVMFSWMLSQKIKDTLCGTKAISRKNYLKLAANRHYFGDFDPFGDFDLIFGANKMNLKFIEIPIRYQARSYGKTNISRFKHGLLLLKMTFFAMNKIKFID